MQREALFRRQAPTWMLIGAVCRMKVLKYPMWEKLWRKNRLRPMWLVHKKEQQRILECSICLIRRRRLVCNLGPKGPQTQRTLLVKQWIQRPSRTVAWLGDDSGGDEFGTTLQAGESGEHADVSRPTEGRGEAWSKIWEGITAKLPSRTTHAAVAEVPVQSAPARPKMSDVPEASTTTGAGRHEGLGVIEALAQSMRQLQELQVKALTKTDADGDSPEVVKTAVTTLPTLDSPEGDQCGLVFQDWMVQITTAMQDLSTSSGVWWESVKEVVLKAYTRSCAMVLQAIPEDMGMSVPDGTVLAQGLTNLTAGAIDVMKYQQHLQAEVENLEVEPKEEQEVPSLGANSFSSLAVSDEIYYNSGTVAGVPPEAKAPTLKVLAIRTDVESTDSGTGAYALVDSGATHPLRRAVDMSEWTAASPVVVHLAGGEVVQLKMNQAGTLLVPSTGTTRTASTAPIVPLGSLVGTLGYRMDWHGSRCRLVGREGDVLNLRVRDGCPEITEQQALNLIARIEDKKLESLKSATEITRARVREAAVSLDKTWFDHLLAYCESGMSPEALLAVDGAPFFEGVPRQALQGLVEAVPFTNGWDALKGLVHLNRKARKRLWESSQWVVHLYAGKRPNEEILFLERQGFVVLELDIERGKSHDVNNPLVWRALEWGARHGRIASVIGGPPQNSFMLRRSMTPGPEALRSEDYPYGGWEGQPAAEVDYVNKHTGYFAKMIYLHALATAGRCKFPPDPADVREVGFMLEQPRDPRGYLLFTDPLYQDARSFWRTPMWFYYAEEAGLSTYSFDMSSLGKKLVRHTTIGTNLPLRHLDGLRGRTQLDPFPPEAAPPSVWSREFSENVAIAVRAQRQTPRMLKMSTDQWREHVRRGHLPYRSDCLTCVMAGATGRRHARVEHPSCFTMSADVSGPLKVPGLDADARGAFPRPHKYLFVAKVRIPKTFVDDGRGTFIEYDPGELEEEGPKEEGSFDFQEESPQGDDPVLPQENEADQEEDDEEVEKASKGDPQRYEDDLDMTGPELVNLVFAAAIPDNKSTTVLEMIQDVILYCSALNIPVFRFHCDRGMEFYAKATRQWLKYHGIRFTTSEGGLHQQNGVVENAVKYVKQRARTLLHGAKLPQRLWPQAVAMAAAAQRATALGYETKLAAPFGARVLVRKREYGGSAEPGKPDDLAPRWVEGSYLGLSETVRRGHVIYVVDKETEKFIHTVHVRTDLVEPEITDIVEAELPGPPSRRLRSKAAGSGDVVSISKAQTVVSDDDLRAQTEALKDSWSQEEAENLCVQIALMLGPNEKIFGAFRHGGAVGLTKATFERQWAAEFLVKTFVMKCPDAEFTSLYVSVNSQRDLHIDSNNMMGKNNYLYPVAMPRRGGDLWVEISDGDVVRGKVTEMMDGRGVPHYGCILPLEQGHITMFNPHRRHAVRSWKGLRVVLVGYTPGVIRKLPGTDREVLSNLGFPISPEGEELIPEVAIRAFSVCPGAQRDFQKGVEEEPWADHDPSNRTCEKGESSSEEEMINDEFATLVREEEVEHWDMFLPLEQGDPNVVPKAKIASSGGVINMNKVEVTYTHNIESLLSSLSSPLAIVHTVEPKEAQDNFGKWLPAVKKELSSFDHTVTKRCARDPQVIDDIRSGRAKVVPMKIVYTVKPPNEGSSEWFRRKARIVACGNMMAASGEDNYAAAAPAEVVRSSLAISSRRGWDAGVIDITSAFLQTPLSKVDCRFRVFGQPPRALIREGLCEEHELWEFTHAVYGLRESPKWWGEFRDSTLANLVVEIEGRKVTLVRCRVESSWWKLVEDSAVIGVIVIYVDDILICSTNSVIAAVANSIKELWSTSPLAMASEGAIKFLGLEIEKIEGGFAVSQADYIAELLRIHNVKGTQRDLIPVSRETASFVATEEVQTGSFLCCKPDILINHKGPTTSFIYYQKELVSWTDASFAPEGARSHTGWLIAAGDAPLSWRSSRQSTVTLSTAEAELVASVEGALALCSLYALWKEIEEEELKLILKTDSTSSIAIQHG
ncbi:RE1, partial [Symbiodinium sp. KB8]